MLDNVNKNVKIMINKGASTDEIDRYLELEGVKPETLRRYNLQQGSKQQAGKSDSFTDKALGAINAVGDYTGINAAGEYISEVYNGQQDPKYKDLQGFSGQGLADMGTLSAIERGKVTTITDKGFGNVLKKALGERLISSDNDQYGQEIITYKGDDGQPIKTYVNKPGLDYQDIDRGINSALPFVAGGGLANYAAKGAGLLGRTITQGLAATGIDLGLQKSAQLQGSGEKHDYSRSALALAGGAGGEIMGTVLTKVFSGRGLLDRTTGKLSEKGKLWALKNKLNPEEIDEDVANYLSQNISRAADPEELAIQARALEFDIPTTKAQRSKSQVDAFNELRMEKGQLGRDAEKIYKNFKEEQAKSIEDAVYKKVGGEIAPLAGSTDNFNLGGEIRAGVNNIRSDVKVAENKLWSEVGPMYPRDGAFKSLPDIVNKKVIDAGISPVSGLTDASNKMSDIMQKFMTGDLKSEGMGVLALRSNDNIVAPKGSFSDFIKTYKPESPKVVPYYTLLDDYNAHRATNGLKELTPAEATAEFKQAGLEAKRVAQRARYDLSEIKTTNNMLPSTDKAGSRELSIDEARRLLLRTKNAAQPGSQDARLANYLYEGFNEWIDDAAEKALIQADDPAAHAALKSARAFTREQHAIFAPRDSAKRLTPAAKKIAKIMEGADSPEGVVSSIFGAGSNVNQLQNGTVDTVKQLKNIFVNSGHPEGFDAVKMAYWVKIVQGKDGKVLSSDRLKKNLDIVFSNHRSILDVMFTPKEKGLILRFKKSMQDLHVDHPNPSLSSIGVGHMAKNLTKNALQTQSKRELFSKHNVLMSRIYGALAQTLNTPLSTGRSLGKRAISQDITKRTKNFAPIGGGVGSISAIKGNRIDE